MRRLATCVARSGIELITWLQLMDDPITASFYQSGLFFRGNTFAVAKPKPFLEGFRFPFVGLRRGSRVYIWAHTPLGKPGVVGVQQAFKGGWSQVKRLRADRNGIAQAVLDVRPTGQFRAILRSNGEKSLPFSMRVPPDQFFNPFGMTLLLEPNGKSSHS